MFPKKKKNRIILDYVTKSYHLLVVSYMPRALRTFFLVLITALQSGYYKALSWFSTTV